MNRVVIGALGAILVITLAWWFAFFSPAGQQLTALQAETMTLEAQQTQLRTQLAQLRGIRDREVEIRADLTRLEQFIPTQPSQASFLRQLQLSADASGVDVTSIAFGEPQLVDGASPPAQPGLALGSLTATGQIEGGYFQVVDFFRRLEVEVARAVLVRTVDIGEGRDPGFPNLSATFTADIFSLITVPVDPNAIPDPTPTEGEVPEGEGVDDASADADETSALDVPPEAITR